jgi:hypothetical protein
MRRFHPGGASLGLTALLLALQPSLLWAQTDPALSATRKPSTSSGSGTAGSAQDFQQTVQQDVANNRLTPEQGAQLIADYQAAQTNINARLEQLGSTAQRDVSIAMSSDQMQTTLNQAQAGIGANGQAQLGGSTEQISEQANAIYNAQLQAYQLTISMQQAALPAAQDIMNDLNGIVAERAAMISANPNVSAQDKFYAQQQATQMQLATDSTLNQRISMDIAQAQAGLAYLENNKQQIVQQYANTIQQNAPQYGGDPAQWPNATAQNAAQPMPTPPQPVTSQQTVPDSSTNPASASSQPYVIPNKGTIPSNAPDPALSVNRSTSGAAAGGAGSGSGGAAGTGAGGSGSSGGGVSNPNGVADPALNAYRNQPPPPPPDPVDALKPKSIPLDGLPPPPPAPPGADTSGSSGISSGAAAAVAFAGATAGANSGTSGNSSTPNPPGANSSQDPLERMQNQILQNQPAGQLLVEAGSNTPGSTFAGELSSPLPSAAFADPISSIEYGDTVPVASLLPIYAGYNLKDQTGSAMMSLNLQVPVPSAVMTVPSMQITGFPGDAMVSLELQPTLCGR